VSMIASTGAVALLPAYPNNLLPWSVTSRPLKGEPPTVDLVVGYHKANTSPILRTFLGRIDDLTARTFRGDGANAHMQRTFRQRGKNKTGGSHRADKGA
jgi:hypothetical protein